MAMDADFSNRGEPRQPAREPSRKVDQIEELGRNFREQQVRSKDVYPSRQRRIWADSVLTGAASGKTGVRAIADIPSRARSTLHRPIETFRGFYLVRSTRRKREQAIAAILILRLDCSD